MSREGTYVGPDCRAVCFNVQSSASSKTSPTQHIQTASFKTQLERHSYTGPRHAFRPGVVAARFGVLERRPHSDRTHRFSDRDGCLYVGMGSPNQGQQQDGGRFLECKTKSNAVQLSGIDGSSVGVKVVQFSTGKENPNFNRQHNYCCLHQSVRGPKPSTLTVGQRRVAGGLRQGTYVNFAISSGNTERNGRYAIAPFRSLRVATEQGPIQIFKQSLGPSHSRPVRDNGKHPVTNVQQPLRGSSHIWNRRPCSTGLESSQQFCESTIQTHTKSASGGGETKGTSDNNCTLVASATVVSNADETFNTPSIEITEARSYTGSSENARSIEEQKVAYLRLEDMWSEQTVQQQWPNRASQQLVYCLAPSTVTAYNGMLRKLQDFCEKRHILFPPQESKDIALFLCELADNSVAPRSQIKLANAALSHMYKGYGYTNVLGDYHVQLLITALVKSGTSLPMQRSQVMPIEPFRDLFLRWPSNSELAVKDLRLKTITLLVLLLMLRPSDIAPKTVHFDGATATASKFVFSTEHIKFCDGGANITFHGIKNDTSRTGFSVFLQPSEEEKLNPVLALQDYISRTKHNRPEDNPVFLTLIPPYRAISAGTVATVLNDAIKLAGLDGHGFSAKSFRPTGATAAIDMKCDPEIAMQLGRWKTRSVFFDHYVHSRPPASLSSDIMELHE